MRLIDADAMTSKIQKQYCEDCDRRKGENNGKRYMIYEIGDAPCRACSIDDMYAELDDAPTIHPEPHWIPVTENCDCDLMDNEEVLVFQNDGTINGQIRHAMFYDFNGKKKFVTWEEGITIYNVLAYMPLPEPFKGATE